MTKLITHFELKTLNFSELLALHRILSEDLNRTDYGTFQRANCLASLENTLLEINRRIASFFPTGA